MFSAGRVLPHLCSMKSQCLKIIAVQVLLTLTMPFFFVIETGLNDSPSLGMYQQNLTIHLQSEHAGLFNSSNSYKMLVQSYKVKAENYYLASSHSSELLATADDIPIIRDIAPGVTCAQLFNNSKTAITKALKCQESIVRDEIAATNQLQRDLTNCSKFVQNRKYILGAISNEEKSFPLAYSIILYRDIDQTERLLRAIYRPQNVYCLHVDRKSPLIIHQIAHQLSQCFPNVFVASESLSVQWTWYSVVAPEIVCMKELFHHQKWKYFINLSGQEFPLKTNLEIVRILKAYNGANDIQATILNTNSSALIMERLNWGYNQTGEESAKYKKSPFPYNITWAKGAVHIAATRDYVDFLISSNAGSTLREWASDMRYASEHVFSSLQMSPQLGVPGAYTGSALSTAPGSRIRFKVWKSNKRYKCQGKYIRNLCVFGVGDLPVLFHNPNMFANKFFADFHPVAYTCLEQMLFNKTRLDISGQPSVDTNSISNVDFVVNHLAVEKSWLRLPQFAIDK